MPAYVTALVTVANRQEILTYAEQVDATVAQHGGRFIVKGGPVAEVLATSTRTPLRSWSSRHSSGPRRGIVRRSIGRSSTIAMRRVAVRSFSFSIPNQQLLRSHEEDRKRVEPMTALPRAERTFFAVCALLFVATAAVTIVWCRSMTAMGGMRMPGGWTMSMAWMQMPGSIIATIITVHMPTNDAAPSSHVCPPPRVEVLS